MTTPLELIKSFFPELGEDVQLRILTPNEPPGKVVENSLRDIETMLQARRQNKSLPSDLLQCLARTQPWVLLAAVPALYRRGVHPERVAMRRRTSYEPTPDQLQEEQLIDQFSGSATLPLAILEPLRAFTMATCTWTTGEDLPPGELGFEFEGSQGRVKRRAAIDGFAVKDHIQQAKDTESRLTADDWQKLRIAAEAAHPELTLAIALGMDSDPARYQWTCTLMGAIGLMASVIVQRLKHKIRVARPLELVKSKKAAVLDVPGYAAYPGGHAFVCAAHATVLGSLGDADLATQAQLDGLAKDIAVRRELAGLHCALETHSGLALGAAVGEWLVEATRHPNAFGAWSVLYARAACEWNP